MVMVAGATLVGGQVYGTREIRLGELIRRRREERGLSQEELAQLVGGGLSQSVLSRIERGALGLPNWERLQRIAQVLGVDASSLMAASGWTGVDREAAFASVVNEEPDGPVMDPASELLDDLWPHLGVADQALLVRMARLMAQGHPRRRSSPRSPGEQDGADH